MVLLWKFPWKETHIEGTQTYVWRGLETAQTASKSWVKSHSAMISLTLNYEGWQNSGPSSPLYTHSEQRYWKRVTIRRVWRECYIREWSQLKSSLTFAWLLLAVNVCSSTCFHFMRNQGHKWGTKTKPWKNIKNIGLYFQKKRGKLSRTFYIYAFSDTFTYGIISSCIPWESNPGFDLRLQIIYSKIWNCWANII